MEAYKGDTRSLDCRSYDVCGVLTSAVGVIYQPFTAPQP